MKILDVFTTRPKLYKKLACKIGWHSDIYDEVYEDKLLSIKYGTCQWCWYKGIIKSSGRLSKKIIFWPLVDVSKKEFKNLYPDILKERDKNV